MMYTHTHTHTHTGLLFSHKKNEIMPSVATWMNLEIMRLGKISQAEKDKYHMLLLLLLSCFSHFQLCVRSFICGILKNGRNELIYNTETD